MRRLVKTSIIILTYNKLEYTKKCIASIRAYTRDLDYEIIIVDNASTDETRNWLDSQEDIISILNHENVGFPRGCNQGIEIATGDNILLLNNDVVVTPNWLSNLLTALYSSQKVGAVGPVTNNASYGQAIAVPYTDDDGIIPFAETYNHSNASKWMKRLKLIGFCLLIKKEVVHQIGKLDERFTPGNYEDDDYCLRIIKQGYELLLCQDTFIHHYGSVSFSNKPAEFYRLLINNHTKFKEKWHLDPILDYDVKYGLIGMLQQTISKSSFKLLMIGGHCGGTAIELLNLYPESQIHCIEANPHAALVCSHFVNVISMDLKDIDQLGKNQYDYILIEELEAITDLKQSLPLLNQLLKLDGMLFSSLQNKLHYKRFLELLGKVSVNSYETLLVPSYQVSYHLTELNDLFLMTSFKSPHFIGMVSPNNPIIDHGILQKLGEASGIEEAYFIPESFMLCALNNRTT